VRVAVQKMPGVESVEVSLERAIVDVRLRAGNRVTLAELRQTIRNNGFNSREAMVTVDGSLVQRHGGPALAVAGTTAVLPIVADPAHPGVYEEVGKLALAPSKPVRLSGVASPPGPDGDERIAVRAVQ
jgi:copper chaperone CopZ